MGTTGKEDEILHDFFGLFHLLWKVKRLPVLVSGLVFPYNRYGSMQVNGAKWMSASLALI